MPQDKADERGIPTTFSVRDVAVVVTAALAVAVPFFAYDTRISVNQNTTESLKTEVAELDRRMDQLQSELATVKGKVERNDRDVEKLQGEAATIQQHIAELKAKVR